LCRDLEHNVRSSLPNLLFRKDKEWLAVATAATVPCCQSFRKRRVPRLGMNNLAGCTTIILAWYAHRACTQTCRQSTTQAGSMDQHGYEVRSCNSQARAEQQDMMQHNAQSRLQNCHSLLSSIFLVCFLHSILDPLSFTHTHTLSLALN